MCEWLDIDTGDKLMLVYFDRPARIRGEIVYEGRSLRFDIETKEAGYVWIRQPEGSGELPDGPLAGQGLAGRHARVEEWGQPPFPSKRGQSCEG